MLRKLISVILLFFLTGNCCGFALASDAGVEIVFSGQEVTCQDQSVSWDGRTLTIQNNGTYILSGTCGEGSISVSCGKKGKTVLMLNGLEISSRTGRVIEIISADEVTVDLLPGSVNRILSLSEKEGSTAIYSKGDLILTGSGMLEITSKGKHGIQSTDSITISSGNLSVAAAGSGLRAHDFIRVDGGTLLLVTGGDGIRVTGDEEKPQNGWVEISGGNITVTSDGDGVQAAASITVTGGTLDITASGGHQEGKTHTDDWGRRYSDDNETADEESGKGLKCKTELVITEGEIRIDSADDAVHSNDTVRISGGTLKIQTGDDGIHADNSLAVTDGTILIVRSYEGLEANQILIAGGDISVTSDDDGINAYGGSNAWGRGGRDTRTDAPTEMPEFTIEDGSLYVNSEGDGLDSNGHLHVRGGRIIVDGPSRSMNGALDSGGENGGHLDISGGTVLAIGASGMAEAFDASSGQCSFCYNGLSFSSGDLIRIEDVQGNVLMEHSAAKSGNSIVFSSPSISVGDRLLLTVAAQQEWIELTEQTTVYGNSGWGRWW